MSSTNRAANRLFLIVIGVVLVIVGAAAAALGALAPVRTAWQQQAGTVRSHVADAIAATRIGSSDVNWTGIVVLAVLVLIVVLLIVFIVRQGNGHTSLALDEADGEDRTLIDTGVVRDLLSDALGRHPELVASSVSSYRVSGKPVLKIAATCRRGVGPTDAQHIIESVLARLDAVVGRDVPALIELSGGFRARIASTSRVA